MSVEQTVAPQNTPDRPDTWDCCALSLAEKRLVNGQRTNEAKGTLIGKPFAYGANLSFQGRSGFIGDCSGRMGATLPTNASQRAISSSMQPP
ncbi:MAG: hypothetical protein ABIU29_12005, partial [Chthoniobacterales bacterium]